MLIVKKYILHNLLNIQFTLGSVPKDAIVVCTSPMSSVEKFTIRLIYHKILYVIVMTFLSWRMNLNLRESVRFGIVSNYT